MTIRAWLTAFAVGLSLLVATPAPTAVASDESLSVRIDRLTPSRLTADATITMAGVIRNTGSAPWTDVQAYLVIPRSPFQTREQIETAIEDGRSYTGERVIAPGTFDDVGDLAPGQSARFRVRVPVAGLGLAGPGGVYPVGVQLLATDERGDRSNNAVARATTFLPWVADPATAIPAGLVWPFTATWSARDPNWAQVVASVQNGQLRRYLDAAIAIPRAARTVVLDPSLLDELRRLADDPPEDMTLTEEQTAAITAWLADLRELALDSTTWITSYARPDELALSRYPENAEELWQRIDAATADALVDHELTGSRASWPTITGVTRQVLEDLRLRGDGPVLVSRASVPDWEPRLGSVVSVETRGGPLPLLVNGTLPDIPGAETAVTARQRILADAALAAGSRASDGQSRADALMIVNPHWNPGRKGGAILAEAVTSRGSGGLTRPTTAGDLVRAMPLTYAGRVPDEVDTRSLTPGLLDSVAAWSRALTQLDSLVVGETADSDRSVAATLSVRLRSSAAQVHSTVSDELDRLRAELAAVSIESPSTITLSSSRGGFPLTIVNDTAHTVLVGLSLHADNPALSLDAVEPTEIGAGERHTVTVEVDLGEQSSSTVTARLVDGDGAELGTAAVFNIRSSKVGLFVWIAMAAAGLLVVMTWARRFLGRRRRRIRPRPERP